MKIIRICHFRWRGNDCVATLKQTKSIPMSDIEYCIQAVSYGMTGMEFRGCICTDNPTVNLGFVTGELHKTKTNLTHIWVPINHVKKYFAHKKIKREEWVALMTEILESEYMGEVQQQALF